MRLCLNRASPWSTDYCTVDSGQIQTRFKVETKKSTFGSSETTSLFRVVPDEFDSLRDRIEQIGEIKWNVVKPCRWRYEDSEGLFRDLFRLEGFVWASRSVFHLVISCFDMIG